MTVKWKYVLGLGAVVGVIGTTAYIIVKRRGQKLEVISFEDAYKEAEARKMELEKEISVTDEEMDEIMDDINDHVQWNMSFHVPEEDRVVDGEESDLYEEYAQADIEATQKMIKHINSLEDDEDGESEVEFEEVKEVSEEDKSIEMAEESSEETEQEGSEENSDSGDEEEISHEFGGKSFTELLEKHYKGPTIAEAMEEYEDEEENKPLTEEDKILKYEADTIDALNQFKRMELADWSPKSKTYQTLMRLYDFPFMPINDGDIDLKSKLMDYRSEFFGLSSKWTKQISYADVILHFARLSVYNVDEDLPFWVSYFLDFNEFDDRASSHKIDTILEALNGHVYHNKFHDSYGLFGLTQEAMTNAIRIADRNIDQSLTYEIEFNEFLKMML